MAKAASLENAYNSEEIPMKKGFILSAFFLPEYNYTVYEITHYNNAEDILKTDDGFIFKTDADRTHIAIEPPDYPRKYTEPLDREPGEAIPYRFKEVKIIKSKDNKKVIIPRKPIKIDFSFCIKNSQNKYFSYIFYDTGNVLKAIRKFLADSFYNDSGLNKKDSIKASKMIIDVIKKFDI